jgi:hypothetical protein
VAQINEPDGVKFMANKRKNADSSAILYLAGGFIVGCIVGRASSSVPLPELPTRREALATYDKAVDAIKALLARAS